MGSGGMSGLLLIGVVLLWIWAAVVIEQMLTSKLKDSWIKSLVTFLVTVVLIPLPVLDEIVGNKVFYSECKKLPPVHFYGAASIGSGHFFDMDGNPRWHSDTEFEIMTSGENAKYLNSEIQSSDEKHTLIRFPIKIEIKKTQYFGGHKKILILESTSLYSSGGWIRESLSGLFGFYSCQSSGVWPKDQYWIKF
jgi:hypothetical protein